MKRAMKALAFALICVLVALSLTGCVNLPGKTEPSATLPPMTAEPYTDYDAVYVLYSQVTFADTLETLTEKFGEPVVTEDEHGKTYAFINEDGYGFLATFFETGELLAKVLNYEDLRQFAGISNAKNLQNAEYLKDSNTFKECVEAFVGRPIEICQVAKDATGAQISRVYSWVDANNDIVQILFKPEGTIESISTSLNAK